MTRQQRTGQRPHLWNSRRYIPLIHLAVLSTAASSAGFAAPRSAKIVALDKTSGKAIASAWLWRTADAAAGSAVMVEDAALFIEDQQHLKLLDLHTGKLRWQAKLPAAIPHGPIAGEEIALVYTRDQIWAYSLADGRRLWASELPADGFTWDLSEAARPAIGDDLIFLCSGKRVAALLAGSGHLHWMYEHPHVRERQTPIVDLDRVFVRTTDPDEPWMSLTPGDGLFVDDSGHGHAGPRPERPRLAIDDARKSRTTISPDRRTLTLLNGRRSWKYQVPAPYTIVGIVGETEEAICIQIAVTAAPASRTRHAAAEGAKG